jgi:hypothetical protein
MVEEQKIEMAFVDWNGNGKHDIQDDFIEYQMYHDCMDNNDPIPSGNHSGRRSAFGVILSAISALAAVVVKKIG